MSVYVIEGGRTLSGEVKIQGSKNSTLPILAATLLCGGESVLFNCPRLSDVEASLDILRYIGCTARREGSTVIELKPACRVVRYRRRLCTVCAHRSFFSAL